MTATIHAVLIASHATQAEAAAELAAHPTVAARRGWALALVGDAHVVVRPLEAGDRAHEDIVDVPADTFAPVVAEEPTEGPATTAAELQAAEDAAALLAANPGALRLVLTTAVTMLDGLEPDDLEDLGFTDADRLAAHRVACAAEAVVLEARP